jgi:hypothetical protein
VESVDEFEPCQTSQPISAGFRIFGWASISAALALALRAVYEQTTLTWAGGPQALSFSLAHEHVGFLLLGIAGEFCLYIWLAGFLVIAIRRRILHRLAFSRDSWVQLASAIFVVVLFVIPYGWWQFATIEFAGPGRGAANQLTVAAQEGQLYLVELLLQNGTKVDIRNTYGNTALNAACDSARRPIADYLISKGANLDYAPSCRRYSEFAVRMNSETPALPPNDGVPKVPGTTIEVHPTDRSVTPQPSEK